jgi:uncharacterized protein YpmS
MTSWVVETTFSTAMSAGILLSWMLWRRHRAKLCEKERKWREAQLSQLESVKERLNEVMDLAAEDYQEQSAALPGRAA